MKNLIFLFLLSIAFSCQNPDDLEPDLNPNENYIVISNIDPPNWSVINKPTDIKALVQYNIAPGELEGQGFSFTRWRTYGSTPNTSQWYGSKMAWNISNRTGQRELVIEKITNPPLDGNPDTLHFRYSISRITSPTTGNILVYSNTVSYIVKQ